MSDCHVDLEEELHNLTQAGIEGEDGKHGKFGVGCEKHVIIDDDKVDIITNFARKSHFMGEQQLILSVITSIKSLWWTFKN